ncbi:hypothetical protein P3T18_003043 [Paraburkholderia sp. GAS199]|uniref:hypothetical protein n=1 Tax=Paraburkholderia sp. GAS199 TaxID=3035126 RepID=UPI003D1EF98A
MDGPHTRESAQSDDDKAGPIQPEIFPNLMLAQVKITFFTALNLKAFDATSLPPQKHQPTNSITEKGLFSLAKFSDLLLKARRGINENKFLRN